VLEAVPEKKRESSRGNEKSGKNVAARTLQRKKWDSGRLAVLGDGLKSGEGGEEKRPFSN